VPIPSHFQELLTANLVHDEQLGEISDLRRILELPKQYDCDFLRDRTTKHRVTVEVSTVGGLVGKL
jgi:hypothetical protein